MDDPKAPRRLFLKTAAILWALSLAGLALLFPYLATLERGALAAAAARTHVGMTLLLAASFAQSAILLAIAVLAGLWASRRLGLETPLIAARLSGSPAPRRAMRTLAMAFAIGIAVGIALIVLDREVFAPIPSVARLIRSAGSGNTHPAPWQGLLASFYGGLDEEILMRLGLMSVLALFLRSVSRLFGGGRDVALPGGVFWTANLVTAVLFGLGHLPATAALAPLTAALVVRAIVLNGSAGIVFGMLFRRFGLEWAMASHFGADIVLHVLLA
ncbi:MAG TPA: CPBP family glutamic-type intramembrane protease [Rhizomicrobium sp.]|nr:CPBP family glutamic-type intramembrane protease [Rhizomicrobium sp.]